MSAATVIDKKQNGQPTTTVLAKEEKSVEFIPIGEKDKIVLTIGQVESYLCVRTRSGKIACREDIIKFMMLCKAQGLNPWVNDAYLVGYDTQDGPKFQLISAHQALLKRAELSIEYDGMASGVCVLADGVVTERQGDLVIAGEKLVGGWARVHRKDRSIPSYDSLSLTTFSTGKSRWSADPAGMIVKCAEASALRKAFPSTLAQMFCREEMERQLEFGGHDKPIRMESSHQPATKSEALATVLASRITSTGHEANRDVSNASETDHDPESTGSTDTESEPTNPVSQMAECRKLVESHKYETGSKNPEGTIVSAMLNDGKLILLCEVDPGPNPTGDHVVMVTDSDALTQVENIIERASRKAK